MSLSAAKRKRAAEEEQDVDQSEDGEQNDGLNEEEGGYIDDEDEPHKFGNSVLPVADLPQSFDGLPQDGMEYLFTVRREERKLPFVTRVHNPYGSTDSPQVTPVQYTTMETSVSKGLIPSTEWQECFEDRFRNLRANMRQSIIHISIPDSSQPTLPHMRERDRWWGFFRGDTEWHRIPNSEGKGKGRQRREFEMDVSGKSEKMRGWQIDEEPLSGAQPDDDTAELTNEPSGANDTLNEIPNDSEAGGIFKGVSSTQNDGVTSRMGTASSNKGASRKMAKGDLSREPTPRILSLLDQKTILQLLKFFTQWIQGHFDRARLPLPPACLDSRDDVLASTFLTYELTQSHGRWIFGLLARLDAQLLSSEISILRNLAREIFRLIKEERFFHEENLSNSAKVCTQPVTGMGETGCWMIVAAVTSVWGQKDLWMDAATALQ
ncbi:hypothetical protein BU17DRAFT_42772 [Hysterangium stoloniferum]|nr:hypothetical protein BU17DRAFT_42772 [Hysterangium stoloniferum]